MNKMCGKKYAKIKIRKEKKWRMNESDDKQILASVEGRVCIDPHF
jgi:hypothetical protein